MFTFDFSEVVLLTQVAGLEYFPNYISMAEQASLLALLDPQVWLTDLKRRVQHYGYRYDYKSRSVAADLYLGPLPDWAASLATQLHTQGLSEQPPDQLIINEYQPGQGISPHVDCVPCFGESVLALSLASAAVMVFTQVQGAQQQVPILLELCSLVVMRGEARYQWKHSIPARKTDQYEGQSFERVRRVPLTFRTIKKNLAV
jgi:alkylated DNA repair dioxygenase AlkB